MGLNFLVKCTKEELIFFSERTSLKGVPRIVKSTKYVFKILWIFVVLLAVTLAGYQTVNLLRTFFSYHVNTVIVSYNLNNEDEYNKVHQKYGSQFPDVTFCNLNPMSSTGHYNLSNTSLSLEDYYDRLSAYKNNESNSIINIDKETQDR